MNTSKSQPAQLSNQLTDPLTPAAVSIEAGFKYCGIGRSAGFVRIKEGTFPRPIAVGTRRRAFLRTELDAWLAARAVERDTLWGDARAVEAPANSREA